MHYLEKVVRLEIRLQRIDEQQHQFVAGVQTQRDGEVANTLDVDGLEDAKKRRVTDTQRSHKRQTYVHVRVTVIEN